MHGVIKPLHPSTNPEILVKIGPLASEPAGLRWRPQKKHRQNTVYSPDGKFAERAKKSSSSSSCSFIEGCHTQPNI